MKILFDQGTPVPLRNNLAGHEIATAFEMGWSELANGNLLRTAENTFDLLVTTDQQLNHQQNLQGRKLAILVITTTSWPIIRRHISEIVAAIAEIQPGEYRELRFKD